MRVGRGRRWALALAAIPALYTLGRVAAGRSARRNETIDPDRDPLPGATLYLRNRRVHLVAHGTGPPLLALHGFGASHYAYHALAPLLADRYTVIAPDLPGFGFSDRSPTADYSYEAQAELMLDLVDRLGLERVAVIGHSMGAAIAMRMAAQAPERIAALVLAGGPGRGDDTLPAVLAPLVRLALPFVAQSRRCVMLRTRLAMARGNPVDQAAVQARLDAAHVKGNARALARILTGTRHGAPPRLVQISTPALVLSGITDRSMPPDRTHRLAQALPRGEAVVLAGAGRLVLEEQPADAAAAIHAFLAPLAAVPAADRALPDVRPLGGLTAP